MGGSGPAAPALPELAPGSVIIDRYEIRERLAERITGAIYRAFDRREQKELALEVLSPDLLRDPAVLERFRSEVATVKQISHPNLCRVFDHHEAGGAHYLTMELIDGESLRASIQRGPTDRARAIAILRDVLRALGALHAKGVVHRALQPETIFIHRGDQRAVVVGFGLARRVLREREAGYMSPEQLRGDELDARSDLFTAAMIGFELVTGKPAFPNASAILRDPPAKLPDPLLASVFERALEKAEGERFDDAEEMIEALEGPPPGKSSKRAVLLGAGLAAAFALAGMAALFSRGGVLEKPNARATVAIGTFENQTGDPLWDPLARDLGDRVRASVAAQPVIAIGVIRPAWTLVGSVQKNGSKLKLSTQIRAADEQSNSWPIEVEVDPSDAERAVAMLERETIAELRLLFDRRERRMRGQLEKARPQLAAYFDLVRGVPRPDHFEPGQRLLDEAYAIDPQSVLTLTERGRLAFIRARDEASAERVKPAIADLDAAHALAPRDAVVAVLRCRARELALALGGDPSSAELETAYEACARALELDPGSGYGHLVLARLEDRRCKNDRAMLSLDRARELDVSIEGLVLDHLVRLATQDGRSDVADVASRELADFQDRERAQGTRALSRRAGVPPIRGAHIVRAGVLMRAERNEEAKAELEKALGTGDPASEASAIRGLKRLNATLDAGAEERLAAIEAERPSDRALTRMYRWIDPEAAAARLEASSASSCVDAIDRARMLHEAKKDAEAAKALDACRRDDEWAKACIAQIRGTLAPSQ